MLRCVVGHVVAYVSPKYNAHPPRRPGEKGAVVRVPGRWQCQSVVWTGPFIDYRLSGPGVLSAWYAGGVEGLADH